MAVGAADDEVRLAALAQATDDRDELAVEGVLRRGDPNALLLSGRQLRSLMAAG